jgi:hypothetical protein
VSQLAATSATIASVSGTNATYSNGNFTSATVTTISGTTATYTSATVTNLALTSLTLANLSITSANVTTLTGTNLTYTSGTVTNLNSTSANITTLTGTTFGTTGATQLRGASAAITNISGTSLTITTNAYFATSSGNVGIGTTNPTFKFVTATSATDGTWLYSSSAISYLGLGGYANGGDGAFQIIYNRGTGGITFNGGSRDTPAARMAIDNSGNVGIVAAVSATIGSFASANITTLTGTTFGTTATTQIRANSLAVSATGARWDANGDIYAVRSGGTSGVIFLGSSGGRYLFYDGSQYYLPGANLAINGALAVTANGGNYNINAVGIYSTQPTIGYVISGQSIAYTSQLGPQILGQGGSAAAITFHRPGAYAINMGLDTDNVVKIGGWSAGAVAYPVLTSNNVGSYVAVLPTVNVTSSTSIAATTGNHYILRGGATTVTLPASPAAGNIVWVTVSNGRSDNVIARNGQNIQGLAENMTLDTAYAAVQLRFSDATMGWVFC